MTLAFLATSSAQDLNLDSLRYCGKQVLSEVDDNLSGVSVDPNDGTLVAVVNNPSMLVRYDPFASTSGCALTKRESIEASAWDSEGVTFLNASLVAVSQEADMKDPIPGQRVIVYDARTFQPTGEAYQLKALDDEPVKHNSGLEGVAYDPSTATFFVAREGKHDDDTKNMAVYSFPRNLTLVATGGEDPDVNFSTVFRGNDTFDDAGVSMTDLAGVSFVPNRDPSLLLLSQETKTIALLRLASKQSTNDTTAVVGSLVVPDEEANQPEGVAWDHVRRRLWVAGEPNELLLWAEDCTAFPRFAGGATGPHRPHHRRHRRRHRHRHPRPPRRRRSSPSSWRVRRGASRMRRAMRSRRSGAMSSARGARAVSDAGGSSSSRTTSEAARRIE